MKHKNILAVCAAAAIASASFAPTVSAAQTYRELVSANVNASLENFSENYNSQLDAVPEAYGGTTASLNVELNDTGRTLLDMIVPVDLSWLKDAELNLKVGVQDGIMAEKLHLLLNDTVLASINYLFALEDRQICFQIPEISDGWINMKLDDETFSQAGEDGAQAAALIDMAAQLLKDPESIRDIYPSAETLTGIISRYVDIYLDHIEENQIAPEQTTINVNGISQDCTMVEASMTEQEFASCVREILETAKTDTDIQNLITTFVPAGSEADPYTMYQDKIDEMLSEIPEADDDEILDVEVTSETEDVVYAESDARITSRLWADEEGTIVGREVCIDPGYGEEQPVFTMMNPANGADSALDLTIIVDDDVPVSFTGTGTTDENGILEGSYSLTVNGQSLIQVTVSGFDTISAENGIHTGNIHIAPEKMTEETDTEIYAALSALSPYSLDIHFESADKNNSNIQIQLNASGSPLGTIRLISTLEEMGTFPALTEADTLYDFTDEEQQELFLQTINPDKILENLQTAGVPQQLLELITSSITGSDTDAYAYDSTAEEIPQEPETVSSYQLFD